jgi:glutamine amidotransferase
MKVAIVDYGSGNLRSAAKAFERAAAEDSVSARVEVTSEPETVATADRIVLPGVGAFADCRLGLAGVGPEAAPYEGQGRSRPPVSRHLRRYAAMADCGREFETVDGLADAAR